MASRWGMCVSLSICKIRLCFPHKKALGLSGHFLGRTLTAAAALRVPILTSGELQIRLAQTLLRSRSDCLPNEWQRVLICPQMWQHRWIISVQFSHTSGYSKDTINCSTENPASSGPLRALQGIVPHCVLPLCCMPSPGAYKLKISRFTFSGSCKKRDSFA